MSGNTVKFPHLPFGLVPKILNAVNVGLLMRQQFRMINPAVLELGNIEHVVWMIGIRVNDAVGNNFAFHDTHQSFAFCVRDYSRINSATTL